MTQARYRSTRASGHTLKVWGGTARFLAVRHGCRAKGDTAVRKCSLRRMQDARKRVVAPCREATLWRPKARPRATRSPPARQVPIGCGDHHHRRSTTLKSTLCECCRIDPNEVMGAGGALWADRRTALANHVAGQLPVRRWLRAKEERPRHRQAAERAPESAVHRVDQLCVALLHRTSRLAQEGERIAVERTAEQ